MALGEGVVSHERGTAVRCRANVAHLRQSRPDYGLGFQVKFLKTFQVVPFSFATPVRRERKRDRVTERQRVVLLLSGLLQHGPPV